MRCTVHDEELQGQCTEEETRPVVTICDRKKHTKTEPMCTRHRVAMWLGTIRCLGCYREGDADVQVREAPKENA